jgi:regulatory protein spx
MIKIYTSPSCSSCRKVKKWFDEQQIPYEEHNIFSAILDEKEIKDILYKSENGFEDIISMRSKIAREQNIDFEQMTVNQLVSFVQENPSVLKRPIMVDDRRIQVGYNEEEIRIFIPKARRLAERYCSKEECPNFDTCDSSCH